MSDLNTFYPEGKKVKIRGEEFAVKPFVLKNRTKVLRIVSEVFLVMSKTMPNLKPEDLQSLDMMPVFIELAGGKLAEIYQIVLDKPDEFVQEIPLPEEFALLQAIVEVNNIPFLMLQVKGLVKTLKAQSA